MNLEVIKNKLTELAFERTTVAAGMRYEMIKGSEVEARDYRKILK